MTISTLKSFDRHSQWTLGLYFSAHSLQEMDNVSHYVMRSLMLVDDLKEQQQRIGTIIAEMCSNSIEHGLLHLDSSLKSDADGFATYYRLRKERLDALDDGYIKICLILKKEQSGNKLTIQVEDSGEGYDYTEKAYALSNNMALSGRGLGLIQQLTQELQILGKGNIVQATYIW